MLFSKSIPDAVLANPTTAKFVSVLDALQEYKQDIISASVRTFNPILCNDTKWLSKQLSDYGFPDTPEGMPMHVLQQMLLNADVIMRLRGSKLGIELLCSVCSLGEVTVDTEGYHTDPDSIMLDTLNFGYVTGDDSQPFLYLCNNNDIEPATEVSISIESVYFPVSGDTKESLAIKSYLQSIISSFLGFRNNYDITWSFTHAEDKFYHSLLNSNFI